MLGFGLAIEPKLWALIFVMVRVGAAFILAPVFGAVAIPLPVRVGLTGAVGIFVLAVHPVAPPAQVFAVATFLSVFSEALVGAAIGFILQIAFAAPTIAETMNFWIHQADEGMAEFRGEPTTAHMNPLGTVHGGWAMALLDSVLGCAVHTTCAPGEGFVSMDTCVKFVRPMMPGTGQVRAIATVQTRGKRVANVEGRVESRDGKVIALGTSTCFIQPIGG